MFGRETTCAQTSAVAVGRGRPNFTRMPYGRLRRTGTLMRDAMCPGCCVFLIKVIEGMVNMETDYSEVVEA